MSIYVLVVVVLLPLGIGVITSSNKVVEYTESYSDCYDEKCSVIFRVTEDMDEPVFLYYEITNMYKNHRLYVKSKDDKQLSGELRSHSDLTGTCENVLEKGELWIGVAPGSTELANPCGLIANSLFNDTYRFTSHQVEIYTHGISWYEDDDRYQRYSANWTASQWTDVEKGTLQAESFSIWMRASATSNNKKLYGRIKQSLKKNTNYTIEVTNGYKISHSWGAGRRLILSTSSAFGGKNYLLGGLLVAVAGIAFLELIVIVLCCRKPGEDNYFQNLGDHATLMKMDKDDLQPDQEVLRPPGDNGNTQEVRISKPQFQ